MTRLDKARNLLEQYESLVTILDNFYWEGCCGGVMYFTEGESEILAEYLINNGIVVPKVKENNK
jgi:hypothetical protein